MGDARQILDHYGISNPFPTSWPEEKDESDESETDQASKSIRKVTSRRSKSRYTILERNFGDRKSAVPGAQKTRDGADNLVQRDEADALGFTDSVVDELRAKQLDVDSDHVLRNRFLLSSTTFTPALYLSKLHADDSAEDLLQGLEFLSRSIDQKSASLKVLVESNFERFVRAKSVIDNVYTEMRNQGAEPESQGRPQSRHGRNSMHWKQSSGPGTPGLRQSIKPPSSDRKKYALTKESEYGVYGIKAPLIEIAVKAEEVWGPALGGRERENNLKSILESIDKSHGVMEIGQEISDSIKRKDFDALVKHYGTARDYVNSAKSLVEQASQNGVQLSDSQVHQVVMTGRMWMDVEAQIDDFKRGIWRDLTSVQANLTMSTDRSHQEDHVALISVLLELGVEDNPIWVWLLSRYDYLKNKINSTFERSRVEIEVCRRRLANAERPSLYSSAVHFKSPSRTSTEECIKHLDTAPILEFWELVVHAMGNLLSLQGGVLGEIVDFWEKAQSFIDGKAQRMLPTGIDGSSRQHHRLSSDGVRDLQSGAVELIDALREHIFSFFADAPIEDISMLFSPIQTESPNTPRTPRSATLSPFSKPDQRFNVDLLSPLPPSPKTGEAWEAFAFWPPYANSLSGVHFLGKIMLLLATASSEMAALQPVSSNSSSAEKLKILLNAVRERSAKAVCAAWNEDAQSCKVLEDWTRGPENKDVTRMPSYFAAFEGFILSGLQKILYIPDAAISSKRISSEIITPPPNKLLQMARSQFVTSLYKALSGMVENAERPVNTTTSSWSTTRLSTGTNTSNPRNHTISGDAVDASSRVCSPPFHPPPPSPHLTNTSEQIH
jgi:exocyst complex component 2